MRRFWLIGLLGILFLATAGSANAQAPMAGQPYAIPAGYEGYSAGTLITYGGYNYVIQDNGTMLLADSQDNSGPDNGTPADSQDNSGPDNGTPADDSVPIDTTAYQIPPGYESSQPGSQISYGGNDYTIMSGGTMMMTNPGCSIMDSTQYQIPPDYAGVGVGSIIPYGGLNYLIGAGVMVKIKINPGYTLNTGSGTSGLLKPQTGTIPVKPGLPKPQPRSLLNQVQQPHLANQAQQPHLANQPQQPHWANQAQQPHWANQAQQPHWANQAHLQQPHLPNRVQQPHWPNRVQQPHWANQVQQPHWANQVQQPHWPNQVQQPHWPNQVYSRGYSGGPAFQPSGNGTSPVSHTGPSSGPVSRPGPVANPGTRRRR